MIGAGLLAVLRASSGSLDSITFAQIIPYTLIAGLFLSNFPEALASSTNMRLQGFSNRRIFLLWFSLMVITAAGAGFGFYVVESLNPTFRVPRTCTRRRHEPPAQRSTMLSGMKTGLLAALALLLAGSSFVVLGWSWLDSDPSRDRATNL